MQLKDNTVKVGGTQPEILIAIMVAQEVFRAYDYAFIITSVTDGEHGYNSKHYDGDAVDIRTRHIKSPEDLSAIVKDIANRLGEEYDVILHSTHLHIEYDPND